MWGILYLLMPMWTYGIMGTGAGYLAGAVNSVFPILLGAFTGWFQRWYPAKVARGGSCKIIVHCFLVPIKYKRCQRTGSQAN